MPNQIKFFATRSGNLTYNASSQTNPVIWNVASLNIGNHYNTSTGRFTAPVPGTYAFWCGMFQSVAVSQLWPIINGVRDRSFVLENTGNANIAGSFTVYLNANDTIGIHSWSGGNTSVTIYDNFWHNFFGGALVG